MTAICILVRLSKTLQDFTFTKATQNKALKLLSFAYAAQFSSAPLTLLSSAYATQLS